MRTEIISGRSPSHDYSGSRVQIPSVIIAKIILVKHRRVCCSLNPRKLCFKPPNICHQESKKNVFLASFTQKARCLSGSIVEQRREG